MCFSPETSLIAGAILFAIDAATAHDRSSPASFPLLALRPGPIG